MQLVIRELEANYDYVLIDAPPLLPVTDATVLSRIAQGAIIVVGSGKIRREQLRRALETLAAVDAPVHGLILNFLPTKGPDAYSYYAYGYDGSKQKDVAVSATGFPMSTPRVHPRSCLLVAAAPARPSRSTDSGYELSG